MESSVNLHSFKSVRIELKAIETKEHLSYATGFLCEFNSRVYLVTNWHVVSGRNFETKETIHISGATPGFIELTFQAAFNYTETTLESATANIAEIPLYKQENIDGQLEFGNTPRWTEHPIQGSDIDVAAIEITHNLSKESKYTFITYDIEDLLKQEFTIGVMDEVFIIGYPLDSSTTPNYYPIYKAATIASEPGPNQRSGLPLIYVDGKTKRGMSGSPVVVRQRAQMSKDEGKITFSEGKIDLVGIYSGRDRLAKDEYEAELGIVWMFEQAILPILRNLDAGIPSS